MAKKIPNNPELIKSKLDTKVGKYFINRQKGMNKKESQLAAGFADGQHGTRIENTEQYKELEKIFYKDELLAQISLTELAEELVKNVKQDKELGAKNRAIEIALNKIEPDKIQETFDDRVHVVLVEPEKVHRVEKTKVHEVESNPVEEEEPINATLED